MCPVEVWTESNDDRPSSLGTCHCHEGVDRKGGLGATRKGEKHIETRVVRKNSKLRRDVTLAHPLWVPLPLVRSLFCRTILVRLRWVWLVHGKGSTRPLHCWGYTALHALRINGLDSAIMKRQIPCPCSVLVGQCEARKRNIECGSVGPNLWVASFYAAWRRRRGGGRDITIIKEGRLNVGMRHSHVGFPRSRWWWWWVHSTHKPKAERPPIPFGVHQTAGSAIRPASLEYPRAI